jgi:hypothetical protein
MYHHIHRHDVVQHQHGALVYNFHEVRADPDSPFFLVPVQQLGDPIGRLLHKPELIMQHIVRTAWAVARSTWVTQWSAFKPAATRGMKSKFNSVFCVQVPLIVGILAGLNFFQEVENSHTVFLDRFSSFKNAT